MYSKGSPIVIDVKANDTVYLCQCGLTKTAPYCDGSHKKTEDKEPFAYAPESDEQLYLCGCGHSNKLPFCDGSHDN